MRISDWSSDVCSSDLTAEDLEREKIGLVSLTESIDTTTPGCMLTFHVFGAIAQFERALIRERTTAGLVEARRQGRKGGRPSAVRPSDGAAARAMMKEGTLLGRDIAKRMGESVATPIGKAHVRTPVTKAQRVCHILLAKKQTHTRR